MINMIELEKRVLGTGLCTGCGACQGLCPYFLSFEGRTICNFECNRTDGRCAKFCPRMPTDLKALAGEFFDKADMTAELGPFKALYIVRGKANDAQHGGTMTALVELAMREGFIDSAVMTKADGALNPEGVLVTDPDKVRECRGVSFQIPPTLAELNKALIAGEQKSIGLVGTPCKTLATYKMKSKPYGENDNNADAIGMVFGLFCGWGLDWKGLDALVSAHADKTQVSHTDILPSSYHSMELEGGCGKVSVDLDEVYPLVRENCRYCHDMTAEFADLSVGGARTGQGWDVDKGWNQLIVRTEKAARLVELAREKGVLEFMDVPEGALDKLKKASVSKKRTAVKNLTEKFGNLEYLEPSKEMFENL